MTKKHLCDQLLEEIRELGATYTPSKAERQKAFLDQCKKEGLSNEEIVKRASVFPKDVKTKVTKWPKL